ncbi:hypothetical protein GCM10009799_42480 [Nocardiopsis rhodophaea]|uniref:Uncharacterized protein n=1 Tax=Nocardiopsis rhodophaea TaxID=280238 RepID=A0ABP5EW14_9ACTN
MRVGKGRTRWYPRSRLAKECRNTPGDGGAGAYVASLQGDNPIKFSSDAYRSVDGEGARPHVHGLGSVGSHPV